MVAASGVPCLTDPGGDAVGWPDEARHRITSPKRKRGSVFLRLRFGPHYRWLRPEALDGERLELYSLAMYLSLVAGPLRLLDGDFPGREPMLAIAEHNLRRALAFTR